MSTAKKRIRIATQREAKDCIGGMHHCMLCALPSEARSAMSGGMTRKSPLDDPVTAAHAWARYRQIMKVLLAATVLTVAIAIGLLFAYNGMISVHFYIAVALGISLTMLLGGGLMGLVFLSNGTGHDESVDNQMPGRDEFWSPPED
jgi:hypothetical protein